MGSYDLSRFLEAQRGAYESALREITRRADDTQRDSAADGSAADPLTTDGER